MRDVSIERPPNGALMWPSNEEPTPKGMIGNAALGADAHGIGDLRRRFRKKHGVGRLVGNLRKLIAVLAADRFALGQPLAEAGAQLR